MADLVAVGKVAAEVEVEAVRWLWEGRVPYGKLTLVVGDPGVGKSLLVAEMAARVSSGRAFPREGAGENERLANSEQRMVESDEENLRRTGNAGRGGPGATERRAGTPVPHGDVADGGTTLRQAQVMELAQPPTLHEARMVAREMAKRAEEAEIEVAKEELGKKAREREVREHFKRRPELRRGVILVAPEDSAGDTLRPRLERAGADLAQVFVFSQVGDWPVGATRASDVRGMRLPEDLGILRAELFKRPGTALVVLDPLHALLAGGNALLETLWPLERMAEELGIAVVLVCHLNKSRALRPLYRARGSIALAGAARSVLLLEQDPDESGRRILVQLKSVLGERRRAAAFWIRGSERQAGTPAPLCEGPRVEWEELGSRRQAAGNRGENTADTAVARGEAQSGEGKDGGRQAETPAPLSRRGDEAAAEFANLTAEGHSALLEACNWLEGALAGGARKAAEVLAEARAAGITEITLRRAKRLVRVGSRRGEGGEWVWEGDGGEKAAA